MLFPIAALRCTIRYRTEDARVRPWSVFTNRTAPAPRSFHLKALLGVTQLARYILRQSGYPNKTPAIALPATQ